MSRSNAKKPWELNFTPVDWWYQCQVCKVCIHDPKKFIEHKVTKHPKTYKNALANPTPTIVDLSSSSSDDERPDTTITEREQKQKEPKKNVKRKPSRNGHDSSASDQDKKSTASTSSTIVANDINDTETTHSLNSSPDDVSSSDSSIEVIEIEDDNESGLVSKPKNQNLVQIPGINDNYNDDDTAKSSSSSKQAAKKTPQRYENASSCANNAERSSNSNIYRPMPKRFKIATDSAPDPDSQIPTPTPISDLETDTDNKSHASIATTKATTGVSSSASDPDLNEDADDNDNDQFDTSLDAEAEGNGEQRDPLSLSPFVDRDGGGSENPESSPAITMHSCCICNKSFQYKASLNCHLVVVHLSKPNPDGPGKIYKCGLCPLIFTKKNELSAHAWIHTDECRFRCPSCGQGFKTKPAFKDHSKLCKDKDK